MNFRASFCDPLQPDIIELGDIKTENIIAKFESINWKDHLQQIKIMPENEIYYSPSLEIENRETKHGMVISAIGDPDNYEYQIFYKRPKKVKAFFGLKEKIDDNYMTDRAGQTEIDVLNCLDALIKNNTDYLANKIGP